MGLDEKPFQAPTGFGRPIMLLITPYFAFLTTRIGQIRNKGR
jgi:hypothetical protein